MKPAKQTTSQGESENEGSTKARQGNPHHAASGPSFRAGARSRNSGAGGGSRTHTALRPTDFEPHASVACVGTAGVQKVYPSGEMKFGEPEVGFAEGDLDGGIAEWRTKGRLRFDGAFMYRLSVMRAGCPARPEQKPAMAVMFLRTSRCSGIFTANAVCLLLT